MESLSFCISFKIYYNNNDITYSQVKQPKNTMHEHQGFIKKSCN